jgi:pimeloyl-ACP methyl ester carboxylesterase
MQKLKDFIHTYIINTDEKFINTHFFFQRWGIAIFIVYLAFTVFMFVQQEHYIFMVSKTSSEIPAPAGLDLKELWIKTTDGERLNALYLDNNSKDIILYAHENSGNLSNSFGVLKFFEKFDKKALVYDYRGFGKSSGELNSYQDFYTDIEAIYNYLITEKKYQPENIILMGRDLGSAPILYLANKYKFKKVILERPFISITTFTPQFMKDLFPKFINKYQFKNDEKIKQIKSELVIIHSKDDYIVPFKTGQKLFDLALDNNKKTFYKLEKGFSGSFDDYYAILEKILK